MFLGLILNYFEIESLIKGSNLTLVIWTASGSMLHWVNQEIGYAKSYGREIVLFKEIGVEPKSFLLV